MKIEDLLKDLLEKEFKNYEEYHLYVLIGFVVIITFIQLLQTLYVSRKIEKFKNQLKKTEIKFSKYSQLQIEALSQIYELVDDFDLNNRNISVNLKNVSPEYKKNITTEWLSTFNKFYFSFSKKKYILPKHIKEDYETIIHDLVAAKEYVKIENDISSLYHTWENGDVEMIGNYEEAFRLSEALQEYEEKGLLQKTNANIQNLKNEIESYFNKIE